VDKICGWKTRPIVRLVEESGAQDAEVQPVEPAAATTPLDHAEASRLQQKALRMSSLRTEPKKRMEISRINPTHCPVVMALAVDESSESTGAAESNKRYKLVQSLESAASTSHENVHQRHQREEVLLVKWRGRSYLHCSWERASDIESLDPSSNNSARNKIRRFYQHQEAVYGARWKDVIEEERRTAASIHTHGKSGSVEGSEVLTTAPSSSSEAADQADDYFSPQCLEVERILACDESEMDMQVFSRQRALNLRAEENELQRQEQEQQDFDENALQPFVLVDKEETWDIEDNVRYVVKWKGSPYIDMTWEYWWDIKCDAVDQVEDFWRRQQAPNLETIRQSANRPHPLIKDFKKLQDSPLYGISKKLRPVDGMDDTVLANTGDVDPGFRLRTYQLEGVNWLLFNWWNKRSCILADEMGLGYVVRCFAKSLCSGEIRFADKSLFLVRAGR
jgi:SNF2 family DNA or RNA helicase